MKGYFHPVRPEEHPLFTRRNAVAVTRQRLGDEIRFVALRGFDTDEKGNLLHISQTIDAYTKEFELCDVIWPVYPTLFAPNFSALIEEIKSRGMYVFDFWGYVPGSNPEGGSIWGEYTPPESAARLLYEELGDHFIGFDNGEQDGRYIGSFAPLMCPASGGREALYKNFCRHFEKLEGHMKNDISLLSSLHFLHYFAKGGNTILLGAETAQALPSANVWFSFIRGAGKQYGLLWFGNASIWNRWGWKEYTRENHDNPYEECGPECGTSLSLLKRLLYTEYLYNSDLLGFESGWFLEGEHLLNEKYTEKRDTHTLSPIGILQERMVKFVKAHPNPGILYTPVCLYLDFYSGYVPPRHLYSKDVCRVWGNRAYGAGDYGIHALLSMLYPDYENAGFFRDEEGFLTSTPYGDIADVLLSDAPKEVLARYDGIVACGEGLLDARSRDDLLAAAKGGATVVLFSGRIPQDDKAFLSACGIKDLLPPMNCREAIQMGERVFAAEETLLSSCVTAGAEELARTQSGRPAILSARYGAGKIITVLIPAGLAETGNSVSPELNGENRRLPLPYALHPAVEAVLAELYQGLAIVCPDNRSLQYSVNFLAPGKLVMLVCNNTESDQAFRLVGEGILQVSEWEISDITPAYTGYTPKKEYLPLEPTPGQSDGDYRIESRDVRIFELTVTENTVEGRPEIPFENKPGTPLYYGVPEGKSIRDAYWELPWFDGYFTGVKLDARSLERFDGEFLKEEGAFARLHKLDGILDFSSLLNHYPDLSLLRNIKGRTEEAIARISGLFEKGKLCGCTKAVFTIHRNAENMLTLEAARENLGKSLSEIAEAARKAGITVYLQNGRSLERTVFAPRDDSYGFAGDQFGKVYNLSHGAGANEDPPKAEGISGVFVSSPGRDVFGQYSDLHLPLCRSELSGLAQQARALCETAEFVCLDAHYETKDEIFGDLKLLGRA